MVDDELHERVDIEKAKAIAAQIKADAAQRT